MNRSFRARQEKRVACVGLVALVSAACGGHAARLSPPRPSAHASPADATPASSETVDLREPHTGVRELEGPRWPADAGTLDVTWLVHARDEDGNRVLELVVRAGTSELHLLFDGGQGSLAEGRQSVCDPARAPDAVEVVFSYGGEEGYVARREAGALTVSSFYESDGACEGSECGRRSVARARLPVPQALPLRAAILVEERETTTPLDCSASAD